MDTRRPRHPLAVARRREQPVHEIVVRGLAVVGQERVDLRQGRRQAGEVERDATDQRAPIGLRCRREPRLVQPAHDERVDRRAGPRRARDGGDVRGPRRDERPVRVGLLRALLGSLLDPLLAPLLGGQRGRERRGGSETSRESEHAASLAARLGPPKPPGADRLRVPPTS